MTDGTLVVMGRLRKRDVEALLRDYDADPTGALERALRIVLERPSAPFAELVADLPTRDALLAGDVATRDALVAELNERRTL